MERIRPTLFVIVVAAGSLLAACGGGSSPAGLFSSGAPLPGLQLRPEAVKIAVKPPALSFTDIGKSFAKKVVVSEKAYAGKFTEHSSCKRIASASPLNGKGPKMTVKVTPLGPGSCSITFLDAKKHKAKLAVSVAPSTPPTATPTPTSAPTTSPTSGPTGSPGPTPTPKLPAAIYVTYSAGSSHPNVVAYDEQGNVKSSGSWGSSGNSPQNIAWAPGDLHWFYVVNGSTNSVEVYSSNGGHLSGFFTGATPGTQAGAMAYPSGVSNLLYVALTTAQTIGVYDEDGNAKSTTFPSNIVTPMGGMTYDSNVSRLYVSNTMSGKIEYYSTSGSLGSSISAPCSCSPGAIAFDSANDHIYVWWSGTGGGIFAYDESGSTVTLSGGSGTPFAGLTSPQAIAMDTHNGYLYVTDGTSVKVFDALGNTITTSGTFSPGFSATSANGITVDPP